MTPRLILAAAALLMVIPVLGIAQEDQPRVPKDSGGAKDAGAPISPIPTSTSEGTTWVGMLAHDFQLDGSKGRPVKLSHMRGQWVVLVFADRKDDFLRLENAFEDMLQFNARIIGVCHEKARGIESFAKRKAVPFEILADPLGQVSSMYGYYDHIKRKTVPGLLILDHRGYVRMALHGQVPPADQTTQLARYTVTGS